jgi:uncharacterized protein YndB with AHSA1/START domain
MTTTEKTGTTQIYRVWIKATPEAIWAAITDPEWTDRYGYGGFVDYGDMQPGTPYAVTAGSGMQEHGVAGPVVDGEIVEADPPRRFVQTWRMLMDPAMAAEGFTRLSYDIDPLDGGVTRLTVTHELDGTPRLANLVDGSQEDKGAGGGWAWVLSDLKSLLETGTPLAG